MGIDEAKKHLARAKKQLDKVQIASRRPKDPEEAVTWAFYAYENCITALAERYGYLWTPNHYRKAELARTLHQEGCISRDVGDDLEELNSLRKDVAYGEPGGDLQTVDLEKLATGLEQFVDEVESRIDFSK